MPESGIKFVPQKELLSYEEMHRLVKILSEMGIKKVRITGGEPFVRKDLIHFLEKLSRLPIELHITTNGVLTTPYLSKLKAIGVKSINLSLDSLDRHRFAEITRRDELDKVMDCFQAILDHDIALKVNMVVMKDNQDDILPMAALIEKYPVAVRFIEEMPFNGSNGFKPSLSHSEIVTKLAEQYPRMKPLKFESGETAYKYKIEGMPGELGSIAAFTRTFCGSCNRIRITAKGQLKTCLYDNGVLDLKDLLKNEVSDDEIKTALATAFRSRPKDGFEAEKDSKNLSSRESMSTIGG